MSYRGRARGTRNRSYSSSTKSRTARRQRKDNNRSAKRKGVVERVKSPKTGKYLSVGGATYWDLISEGYTLSDMRKAGSKRGPPPQRRFSSSSGTNVTSAQLKMQVKRSNRSKGSRSNSTESWGQIFPRQGRERREVMQKCGSKCFLDPEHELFPICSRLGEGQVF